MATTLYDGITNFTTFPNFGLGTPGIRKLAYGQIPVIPPPVVTGIGTGTLGTGLVGYAGYSNYNPLTLNLLPSFTTKLDASTGFSVAFTLQVNSEFSNPNRAGFSLTVTSANQSAIELGFRTSEIFAQSSNFLVETSNSLHNTTIAANYELKVVNGQYTLLAGGNPVGSLVNQSLVNYSFNPALSTPPLPFNPYTSPNLLFFGDNTDQGNANFTISNISVNALPVPKPDSYQTPANTPLNIAVNGVLANDTDADGDPLTAILVTPASLGTVTLNPNGSFIYTPNADVNGGDTFQYRVNDGTANSREVVTTSITVGNPPAPLSPGLLTLLQNPAAPPTPAPVVVGTPSDPGFIANPNDSAGILTPKPIALVVPDEEITYLGTPEDDVIVGTAKREVFYGFGKKDFLRGKGGDDRFFGGRGSDTIFGGAGNDELRGGRGNDYLNGGKGDDLLIGDKGTNILTGGAGRDRFRIGKGKDTITDFVVGEDSLELTPGLIFGDLVATQGVGATVISTRSNAFSPNFQAIAALVGVSPQEISNLSGMAILNL